MWTKDFMVVCRLCDSHCHTESSSDVVTIQVEAIELFSKEHKNIISKERRNWWRIHNHDGNNLVSSRVRAMQWMATIALRYKSLSIRTINDTLLQQRHWIDKRNSMEILMFMNAERKSSNKGNASSWGDNSWLRKFCWYYAHTWWYLITAGLTTCDLKWLLHQAYYLQWQILYNDPFP